MDLLGRRLEPTFLDWTERLELVGLDGERFIVSVAHTRGSRRMDTKVICSTTMYTMVWTA
jgi:hypothetical protein